MDVHLPCEEEEYESGNIPNPRTLEEYDMREFSGDEREFSSFAEMVGLTRSLDLALAARKDLDLKIITTVCANVDAIHVSWTSLLPASKRTVFRPGGSLDETLFKAHAIIHTWIVDLHRQLSNLAYSAIEGVSKCCPQAPPESLLQSNSPESDLHTRRVLHSIEQFESQEISVIAREILSLDRPLPSPSMPQEPQHPMTGISGVTAGMTASSFALAMAAESLDFCDLFDIDYHEATIRDALTQDLVVAECCV